MTEIFERATKDLVPYARNPRKNDAVVDQKAASIREFGFKVPVLALSDRTIVDGHLRLKAAQKLRIETVPVILCDEWTPAQVKAFRLMANNSVAWAEWDTELLRFEMEELKSLDFDLDLTGFGEHELARILEPAQIGGLTDPDSVHHLPSNPATVPGDLWILGKHRLLCGDSTFVDQVQRLFNGVEPILIGHRPAVRCRLLPKWRNSAGLSQTKRTGVRIGEALGLQWKDLDLEKGIVLIRRNIPIHRQVQRTKTKSSERSLDLSPELVRALQSLLRRRREEWFANGKTEIPKWVFCGQRG